MRSECWPVTEGLEDMLPKEDLSLFKSLAAERRLGRVLGSGVTDKYDPSRIDTASQEQEQMEQVKTWKASVPPIMESPQRL